MDTKHKKILEFLISFRDQEGYFPNYREIAEHMGFASTNAVSQKIAQMESLGYIEKINGASRAFKIL